MEGYDPSLTGVLRRKCTRAFQNAWRLLPVWYKASERLEPASVLDAREIEIYRLYGMNRTPKEIAIRLFISIHSSETRLNIISRKLHIRRRDLKRFATEYVGKAGVDENPI